ncbi:MAG: transketolase [Clostridiales Family XIII bacterium]|jgi:transketolase|nr:transketolase [Clostridiales Family XIII bacterium]
MNEQSAVNAIRILSADAVQKANSGHPGFPLGAAPIIYSLFAHGMNHAPQAPDWFNRDRFVLSAGHGSAMLYSTLHLFGYPKVTIDELKRFRQYESLTPGHPEYDLTPGVEATTGPLGAGMGMAVGMAIAEAHLAAKFNKDDCKPIDHYTFALGGEGCLMEGISSEVFSLAGTLGLGKLIILYDSNDITIEGSTELAFTEDVGGRMEAFGFQVLSVEDGTDIAAIGAAIAQAKQDTSRPSFIKVRTQIGYGVPERQGTAKAHGEPLGEGNVRALRASLGWEDDTPFAIPTEIYEHYNVLSSQGQKRSEEWQSLLSAYTEKYPKDAALLSQYISGEIAEGVFDDAFFKYEEKADASRNISGRILNELKDEIPFLIGGSADLAPSNKTQLKDGGDFAKDAYGGRNLHFGVRELGMTAIGNGILLHGGLRSFVATFFVFADYMKPMLRLSALMGLPLIAILTHDSIGVGEDGPTHEPVEQLTMLRSTPNLNVFRPADEYETRVAWKQALLNTDTPSVLALTRQNLPVLEGSGPDAEKGAYIIAKESANTPTLILLASGSEVSISIEAGKVLEATGIATRVVSVPCMDIFEQQPKEYRESVLPASVRKRLAVEAGSSFSWGKVVGPEGAYVTMDRFGASAPASLLFETFGFHKDHIVERARELLNR